MKEGGVKTLVVTGVEESEALKVLEKPHVIEVLEAIIAKGRIKPIIGLETGIRYLELEMFPNWEEIINELLHAKLIEKVLVDMVVACPRCESIHVSTRYHCRYCGSFHVVFSDIVQHIVCGYIDTRIKFETENGKLICPRCGAPLRREGVDYIVLGKVFECRNCQRRMDRPEVKHVCRHCGLEFTIRESKYLPIYAYRLSPLGEDIISKGLHMRRRIISLLSSLGYKVEENAKYIGFSGVEHTFDILAIGETNSIAIDFIGGDEKEASSELLSRAIKALDVGTLRYVVIVRHVSEHVKRIVENQGVTVIEGYSYKDVEEKLKEIVMS